VSSSNYGASGCPVLTAGQTFLLGYTLETDGIFQASENRPVIIFDDFTTAFKWVDFPFKAKSSAMKMIQASSGSSIELRFLFYLMGVLNYRPGQHARHWISVFSNFEIPWPPLVVQREIVSILDKFTQLEAELEAELEARRSQYEHTRDQLLDFSGDLSSHPLRELIAELCPEGVPLALLGDGVNNRDNERRPVTRELRQSGIYPYYGANGVQDYVQDFIFDGEFLLVGEDGSVIEASGAPVLNWAEGKIWVNNHAHVLQERTGGPILRFLYFYLSTINVSAFVTGGSQKKINQGNLNNIPIPLPPLEVQREIVSILDKLDALVNDLTFGLPAEISARRKQYEHYRNKLLTFKELEAA
jgi:type I restriction enzyme S subunit